VTQQLEYRISVGHTQTGIWLGKS